jgi:glycosyltransferase involved in cell wall biosynthesis
MRTTKPTNVAIYQVLNRNSAFRGPGVFFPLFNRRFQKYYSNDENIRLIYIIKTDDIEVAKEGARNHELEESNIIFLPQRNNRLKHFLEFWDFLMVILKHRIKAVTFITFSLWDPDPKLFFLNRLRSWLGVKLSLVVTYNGHAKAFLNDYQGRFEKYIIRHERYSKVKWDGVISWYADTLELVEKSMVFGKPKVVKIIESNFCDDSLFQPEEKSKVIYWAGALMPYKRPMMFLEAINLLVNSIDWSQYKDWKFSIIGSGPMMDELLGYIEVNKLDGIVEVVEFHKDYYNITNRAMAHVSTQEIDHFPNLVINEAMASRCAVIATSIGRVRKFVDEGQTGILCDDNYIGLSAALRTFIELSDEDRDLMMTKSRELMFERHSDIAYVNTFRSFWSDMLNQSVK